MLWNLNEVANSGFFLELHFLGSKGTQYPEFGDFILSKTKQGRPQPADRLTGCWIPHQLNPMQATKVYFGESCSFF